MERGGDKDKREVVAGEKGTPCLFYQSGTCRRDPCSFVHDPAAKSKTKANKAGSSVAAAFAVAAGNLPSATAVAPRIFNAVVSLVFFTLNHLNPVVMPVRFAKTFPCSKKGLIFCICLSRSMKVMSVIQQAPKNLRMRNQMGISLRERRMGTYFQLQGKHRLKMPRHQLLSPVLD